MTKAEARKLAAYRAERKRLAESIEREMLRDRFAIAALQGILSSASMIDRTTVNKLKWARVAYAFADAMLKARK